MLELAVLMGIIFAGTFFVDSEIPKEDEPEETGAENGDGSTNSEPWHSDNGEVSDTDSKTDEETEPNDEASGHSNSTLNYVFGSDQADVIVGPNEHSFIDAGKSQDIVFAGSGNDHIVALGGGIDTIFGGAGDDTIYGFAVKELPDESNFLIDALEGSSLFGGAGNDLMMLGSSDISYGGDGADCFQLSWDIQPGSPAQIHDFSPDTDKVEILVSNSNFDGDKIFPFDGDLILSTQPMQGEYGTSITVNGVVIADFFGVESLDANEIEIVRK